MFIIGFIATLFALIVSIQLICAIGLAHGFTMMFILLTIIGASCSYQAYKEWKEERK